MQKWAYNLIVVSLFSIAMGFLEAVVVVYLREIYYPEGFAFPLSIIEPQMFSVELVRELTTLIMLVSIGLLVGKTGNEKFAWFLFTFGIWDIFYYVGLKLFLNWPSSVFTWDILFLIPVTWIGPVLAPLICSATMILLALIIQRLSIANQKVTINYTSWLLLIGGAMFIFASFIQDYSLLLINSKSATSTLLIAELGAQNKTANSTKK